MLGGGIIRIIVGLGCIGVACDLDRVSALSKIVLPVALFAWSIRVFKSGFPPEVVVSGNSFFDTTISTGGDSWEVVWLTAFCNRAVKSVITP